MFNDRLFIKLLLFITLIYLLAPGTAYAYIDPGTGSYILQILIAAFIAAAFAIRSFWENVKMFFRGLFKNQKEDKKGPEE